MNSDAYKIHLDISLLDNIIQMIFSENTLVTKKSYYKIKKLFDIIDIEDFNDNRAMEVRIYLINKLVEGYIDKGIQDYNMLKYYPIGGEFDKEINDIYQELINNDDDLSNDMVAFIDGRISNMLQYKVLFKKKDKLSNLLLKLDTGDFKNLMEIVNPLTSNLNTLLNKLKEVEAKKKYEMTDFGNNSDSLMNIAEITINNKNKNSNYITTGLKGLNDMLGGHGYEAGRVYTYFAISGGLTI
jgi:hypothetical protein